MKGLGENVIKDIKNKNSYINHNFRRLEMGEISYYCDILETRIYNACSCFFNRRKLSLNN